MLPNSEILLNKGKNIQKEGGLGQNPPKKKNRKRK